MKKLIKLAISRNRPLKSILIRLRARITNQTFRYLDEVRGVIHVGANSGQERELYAHYGLDVLWIEPIPAVFEILRSNISAFLRQNAVQALVTDVDGHEYKFNVASNEGASSSIYEFKDHHEIWPDITYNDTIRLTSKTLPTLLSDMNVDVDRYNCLVLDVQGAEMLVLKGALPLMDRFDYIQVEAADFEMYAGEAKISELQDYLRNIGFFEVARHKLAEGSGHHACFELIFKKPFT
jgi:FkbM family methyltransferase